MGHTISSKKKLYVLIGAHVNAEATSHKKLPAKKSMLNNLK